ncbi:alpha/beta hydrolase [Variovorax sp. UMC13]|uniref:alpha/beta hydrolase n=1 Tax=Variovorax sp. UMC13 TaxID=1862326 RepID=UPI0016001F7E|nr:alpha/beta hydrolase [Variovorax sp. UMC13]MBB1603589.1 alpha/beta hydrolase [Variovorax sp. UMC13]
MPPFLAAAWVASALLATALPAVAAPPAVEPAAAVRIADRISVRTEGQGPDLILIPGLASSKDVWDQASASLRQTHRLHRVQVAGFAGTAAGANAAGEVAAPVAEAIARYIAQHQLKAPIVVGHSLGGEVALMLAARHPEAVGGLVVVDALPFFSLLFDPAATVATSTPDAAVFRDNLLSAPKAQADALQAASVARLVKTPSARAAVVEAALRSDRTTVANASYELMTTDLRSELERIRVPVQVIYAWDPLYGVPAAAVDARFRGAYAGLAKARFTRIDDSFHFVMLDQPQRFVDALRTSLEPDH